MNILILSCGIRNKIIQYFKKEIGCNGKVIATDCSELAPALYEADKHYIVPRIDEEGYLDEILSICIDNNINGVLSLIDPELSLLASHRQDFLDIGTVPVISEYKSVELSFNKYNMYNFLKKNGFKTAKSYVNKVNFYRDVKKGLINYPVFVKPIKGSASINTNKAISEVDVELLFNRFDNLIIQEFLDGIEYDTDVYIDMISGKPTAIFAKKKIKRIAGETVKSVSIKDEKLFDLVKAFTRKLEYRGIIDIDFFKIGGEYYISEVNPRIGGTYPHAYECGVNLPRMIVNNLSGKANCNTIGEYEEDVYALIFNDIKTIKISRSKS